MRYRPFVYVYGCIVGSILIITILLNFNNVSLTQKNNNVVLLEYQNKKLKQQAGDDVELVVLGGSSAGNAIDSEYMTKLSGIKSVNLALNGSYGIEGSVMMIQKSLKSFEKLKYIVIIHSLDIWDREFSYQGVFRIMDKMDDLDVFTSEFDDFGQKYMNYLLNTKIYGWYLKEQVFPISYKVIDEQNDYLAQYKNKFSNGGKVDNGKIVLPEPFSNQTKKQVFKILDELCGKIKPKCIFMNGPFLDTVVKNSPDQIKQISEFLNKASKIQVIPDVFEFPAYKMGDAGDHVSPQFKKESTEKYYRAIFSYLK